jgi:succinate dehydrogenase/fumarate reductase flavoprotein subunit
MSGAGQDFDLIVLGAGAGGMTAAVVCAREGLRVVVVEKTEYVGGTTAVSGGMVWVPDNHLMGAADLADSRENARAYLAATVPKDSARASLEAYLDAAPKAIRYLCENTEVRLRPVPRYPDYYPDLPGATLGGRVLEPEPFDGARLGDHFAKLRPPLAAFTILGGMMVARADIPHFRNCTRSLGSFMRVAQLVARHGVQRLRYPRGTSLVLGNALAGRLYLSALEAGVSFRFSARVEKLLAEDGCCTGVVVDAGAGAEAMRATKGVVIATGGFSHDRQLRDELMPQVAGERSATVSSAAGDGIRLATAAGAVVEDEMDGPAFWVPVSRYVGVDGREVIYPHTVTDRAKPGLIAVDTTGCRFVNEAVSYHEFVRAMLNAHNRAAMRAYLICDRDFLWRYGLGAITPFTRRLDPYLRAGYLKRADTIAGLAQKIGVDADALTGTVTRFNAAAANGEDPEFGRGSDDYQRHLGDAERQPNPCVAPILASPYYSIEVRPGDLGTAAGLRVDNVGRVQSADGEAIPGLYAVGNDAASIMQGNYPGPGITLGPALTYGYLIGRAAARA